MKTYILYLRILVIRCNIFNEHLRLNSIIRYQPLHASRISSKPLSREVNSCVCCLLCVCIRRPLVVAVTYSVGAFLVGDPCSMGGHHSIFISSNRVNFTSYILSKNTFS